MTTIIHLLAIIHGHNVILSKEYSPVVKRVHLHQWLRYYQRNPTPVTKVNDITFCVGSRSHRPDLRIVAATSNNGNAPLLLSFLQRIHTIFNKFLGETYAVEFIQENLAWCGDLLEELVDHGVPQVTEPLALCNLIIPVSDVPSDADIKPLRDSKTLANDATRKAMEPLSWNSSESRSGRREEWHISVCEKVFAMLSGSGMMVDHSVTGDVFVDARLSGRPRCTLALTGLDTYDHVSTERMVQCDEHNVYHLVPPNIPEAVLHYRKVYGYKLPAFLEVRPSRRAGDGHLDIATTIGSFEEDLTNVVVTIPMPTSMLGVSKVVCSAGKTEYDLGDEHLAWTVKKLSGRSRDTLELTIDLAGAAVQPQYLAPAILKFEMEGRTASKVKLSTAAITYVRTAAAAAPDACVRRVIPLKQLQQGRSLPFSPGERIITGSFR